MSQSSPARATRPKRPVLSSRARQFWLTLHYFSLLAWVAGAGGCVLLVFFSKQSSDPSLVRAAQTFVVVLDHWLVIPGAIGSFVTGVWLSWRTNWGLTRYWWIMVKLALTTALMLLGIFYMHGLIEETFQLSRPQTGLESAALISARLRLLSSQGLSLLVLLGMVVISVYKPWGKRGAGRPAARSTAQR